MDDGFVDDTLTGNEIIEEAIRLFYQENSDRGFMGICMAIRKRMQEEGHLIFPARVIEEEDTQLYDFRTLKLEGGHRRWWHLPIKRSCAKDLQPVRYPIL